MAKNPRPFTLIRRTDSKSFRLTLNPSCGLPDRVCAEWRHHSFLYRGNRLHSKVWFNTPRLTEVQTTYCFQKFGIKPDFR
jgi:hypothetical protein